MPRYRVVATHKCGGSLFRTSSKEDLESLEEAKAKAAECGEKSFPDVLIVHLGDKPVVEVIRGSVEPLKEWLDGKTPGWTELKLAKEPAKV